MDKLAGLECTIGNGRYKFDARYQLRVSSGAVIQSAYTDWSDSVMQIAT